MRRRSNVGVALALAMALVACGDGDGDDPVVEPAPTTDTTADDDGTVDDDGTDTDGTDVTDDEVTTVVAEGVTLGVAGTASETPESGLYGYELTLTVRNDADETIGVLPLTGGPTTPQEDEGGNPVVRSILEPDPGTVAGEERDAPPTRDGVAVPPGETRELTEVLGLEHAPPIELVVCLEVRSFPGATDGQDRVRFVAEPGPRTDVPVVCSDPTTIG